MTKKLNITNPNDFAVFVDGQGNQVNDITEKSKQLGYCCIPSLREKSPKFDKKLWNELIRVGKDLEKDSEPDFGELDLPLEYEVGGKRKSKLEFGDVMPDTSRIKVRPNPMIEVFINTMIYYGAGNDVVKQMKHDMYIARYRLWDLLGMYYTGALCNTQGIPINGQTFECVEKMVKLYIKMKDVGGFFWFLRGHDLDVEKPKRCKGCIKSYKDWVAEIPKKRSMNDYV